MTLNLKTIAIIVGVVVLSSCRSTIESTQTEQRDTTVTFRPPPIDDTTRTHPDLTVIPLNPACDTLSILELYGSFDAEKEDSSYFWRARYDAVTGKLRLLEKRPAETKTFVIESIYKQTKVVKDGLWDRIKTAGVGAVVMFGLCLIAVVILKFKSII